MRTVVTLVTVMVLVGCALTVSAQTTVVVGQAPVVGTFSGEVWTWDSARSIVTLYDALARLNPSPVVELNRGVAVAMAFGPAAGLEIVDALTSEPSLQGYHLLPSVRGDFLKKLGRLDEARAEFERAASLTRNARERTLLLERATACTQISTEAP